MLTEARTINILGTEIRVIFKKESEDHKLKNLGGYFDCSKNLIVIKIFEHDEFSCEDLEKCQIEVLRHEIIHAFLHESGLDASSGPSESWAVNEEMIDWFAIQAPKIFKVFREQKLV